MRSDDIESRPVFILTLLGKVDLWSIDWYGNKRIIQSCLVMNRESWEQLLLESLSC